MDTLTFPDWGNRGFLFLSKSNNNIGPTLRRRVSSKQADNDQLASRSKRSIQNRHEGTRTPEHTCSLLVARDALYTSTYSAHIYTKSASPLQTPNPKHHREKLTILNPNTILHQNSTLFNSVLPLTHLLLCTMTMGICSIMAKNP